MLPRVLEPEVMDTVEEAVDYDSMDHSEVNRRFVDEFLDAARESGSALVVDNGNKPLSILDVGTGTALIPIELGNRSLACTIHAIDLATEMLRLAEQNLRDAGLSDRVILAQEDAKSLSYVDGEFDAVISNSIVHHIPEPAACLAEMLRVLRPGGFLFVRDLLRPETEEEVETIVRTYAGNENEHQRQLFRQSLHAALTVTEMQDLMRQSGWPGECVTQTSDRHWTVSGTRLAE